MDGRLAALVVVALCVVALGAGAGSLATTPWSANASDGGDRGGAGEGIDAPETGMGAANASEIGAEGPILPTDIAMALLLVFVVLGVPGLVRMGRRQVALMVLSLFVLVAVLAVIVNVFSGFDPSGSPGGNATATPSNGSTDPVGGTGFDLTTLMLYGVVGLTLALAVGLVFRSSGSVGAPDEEPDPEPDEPEDPEAVAAAAGRAADYIERDPDLSNAVYRAWSEMTDALEVREPETSTPGEFATAAVAAGMDREDVGEITELFEEVRYGAADPSQEREQRAIAALRRIEERYAADFEVGETE